MTTLCTLYYLLSLAVTRFSTLCAIRCQLLSLVFTRCQSLYHRHLLCESLSFVVTRYITRCLFINDLILFRTYKTITSKRPLENVFSFI